jgi:serine protease inhibitor
VAAIGDKANNGEALEDYVVNSPFHFSLTMQKENGERIPLFMGRVVEPRKTA